MLPDQLKDAIYKHPAAVINDFSLDIDKLGNGIIFFFASWSPTLVQLASLHHSLQAFSSIRLHVVDIDHKDVQGYYERNGLISHGWGETYWIKEGKVVDQLKKYDTSHVGVLETKHRLLVKEK
jgi:hypothetical protein